MILFRQADHPAHPPLHFAIHPAKKQLGTPTCGVLMFDYHSIGEQFGRFTDTKSELAVAGTCHFALLLS